MIPPPRRLRLRWPGYLLVALWLAVSATIAMAMVATPWRNARLEAAILSRGVPASGRVVGKTLETGMSRPPRRYPLSRRLSILSAGPRSAHERNRLGERRLLQ